MATTNIEIPAGMDPAAVQKMFATFVKSQVTTKARDKARAYAAKKLKEAHTAEFDKYVAEYKPK